MSTEITTTIKMPKETLIRIKSLAVEKGTSQKNIINDLLNKALKITDNKTNGKIKARVINKEMIGYNPDKKHTSMDLIGIVKVDNPEKIDVQELKDSIHFKKELY
ncbi:MAG: ribbon-helix-helix domain-containing protein [Methanobrevibacter sp.]|nr:ribbon-helix-helix domain-containing protein [Methanobrevibacter sp.]